MKINYSSLDTAFLPDIFFTKILLETSSTPKNTRKLIGARANPVQPRSQHGKRSVNQGGALQISLSLTVMDHIDENGLTSWFYNEDLTKYLKIKIIQSKSPKITNALMKNNFSILDNNKFDKLHDEKIIPIKKDYDQNITDFISFDTQQNKRVFSVNYTTSFVVNDTEPSHLAYFAFCYLDLKDLVAAYDMAFLLPDSKSNIVRGQLVGEKVIAKSTLQLETYAFFLEREGTPWPGPKHRMAKTSRWMTGATNTSDSQYLIRRKMANNKIQDFREINAVKLMDFDLVPAQNFFASVERGKKGTQRVIQNAPDIYFSDAFLSYTVDGGSKFLFQLDYNRIIRDKTQFGNIIDKTSNPDTLAQIYKASKITLLTVFRRRVRYGVGDNRLGSPVFGQVIVDPVEPVITLISSTDGPDGKLKKVDNANGSIKEIVVGSQNQFRTFTITDTAASAITDGFYQYGVQVEMRDGTIDYLNNQLQRLSNIKRDMNLYYSIASSPTFYNPSSQKFTNKLNQYYSGIEKDERPWIKSVAFFMDIITSLTFVGDPKSMGKRFFAFISPASGNLEGINAFLSVIEGLESKLSNILGSKIHLQTPGNEKKRMVYSKLKVSMISITRFFNEIWDSNERPDMGLDYLSLPDISDTGLKGVTVQDYKDRVKQENSLYWTDTNLLSLQANLAQTAADGITPQTSELLNLSAVEYSYLTPGTIYAGTGLTDNRLDQGQAAFDTTKFTAITNALIASSTSQWASAYQGDGISTTYAMPKVGDYALENILGQLNVSLVEKPHTNFQLVVNKEFRPEKLAVATILGPADLEVRGDLNTKTPPTCDDKNAEQQDIDNIRKLLPIGTIFIQNLALTGQLNNRKGLTQNFKSPFISPDKKSIANFDLNTSNNIIDKLRSASVTQTKLSPRTSESTSNVMTRPADPENALTKADFNLIPNQIRSLILGTSNLVINKWPDMNFDLIRDVETSEFYRYNFDMISKVEILIGYEVNAKNLNLMMSPQFRLLTGNDLENLKSGQLILCRVARYTNERLGIGISNGIDVKFFDEYFLISSAAQTLKSSSRKRKTKSVNKRLGLNPQSVGYNVLGALSIESEENNTTSTAFKSNMVINQSIPTKLDIL